MNEIEIKATINKVSEQRNAALNDAVMIYARAENLSNQLHMALTEVDQLKMEIHELKQKPRKNGVRSYRFWTFLSN